jgi:hypothetical protein
LEPNRRSVEIAPVNWNPEPLSVFKASTMSRSSLLLLTSAAVRPEYSRSRHDGLHLVVGHLGDRFGGQSACATQVVAVIDRYPLTKAPAIA